MDVSLRYGREEVVVPVEPGRWLGSFSPRFAAGLARPEEAALTSLRKPLGSPPLRELARGARTAAILVSDLTRITRSDLFVKLLADELNAAGVPDGGIHVYLATGTHSRVDEAERHALLGEALGRVDCIPHDPTDRGNLVDLGETSFGTPIRINRRVYESDVKVLTGRITHHYFAGFSGGRKAIAPGVSSLETILANHKRVMNPQGGGRHPEVFLGSLDRNPVHLDLLEIAEAASPTFCLNTILNVEHEVTHFFGGDYRKVHEAGCKVADSLFRLELPQRADVALASCGGWPYDISFMQVVKTIVAAERAVADGGVLVLFGHCGRGLESGFLDWFRHDSLEELNRDVLAHYNLKGHNSYWVKEILARIRIVFVSSLPDEPLATMGFLPAHGPREAMTLAYDLVGRDASVLAIPYGNVTVFS